MLLSKFDPFGEMENMQRAFSTLAKRGNGEDESISAFIPKVNTREDEQNYYIDLDLPGVKKEDINIDVDEGTLSIYGERDFKEEVKEEDYYKVETSFGKFQRTFSLPDNVDVDAISAATQDGVLEVTIPKKEQDSKKKKIAVK